MSQIKQCDRCKKLENFAIIQGGIMSVVWKEIFFFWEGQERKKDLCIQCFEEFMKFVRQ